MRPSASGYPLVLVALLAMVGWIQFLQVNGPGEVRLPGTSQNTTDNSLFDKFSQVTRDKFYVDEHKF